MVLKPMIISMREGFIKGYPLIICIHIIKQTLIRYSKMKRFRCLPLTYGKLYVGTALTKQLSKFYNKCVDVRL